MATFANLKDDGTTTAGDWIYTGSYPDSGNLMQRKLGVQDVAKHDPTGMGFFPGWAWSWPLHRRAVYYRASADLAGNPWRATRPDPKTRVLSSTPAPRANTAKPPTPSARPLIIHTSPQVTGSPSTSITSRSTSRCWLGCSHRRLSRSRRNWPTRKASRAAT